MILVFAIFYSIEYLQIILTIKYIIVFVPYCMTVLSNKTIL